MLSEQEKHDIDGILEHIATKRAGCIEAMKIVQSYRRWISDDSLADIASYLEMTPAELDSVATFYNLIYRKPVGEHVIRVCDSISCWLMGEESVMDYLQRKLGIKVGGTTPDGKFTLLPNVCLGHCELAPVMMLDEEIIGNLTEEKIDQVLSNAGSGKNNA